MSTTYCTNCGAAIATGTFCATCGKPAVSIADQTILVPSTATPTNTNLKNPIAPKTNVLAIVSLVTSLLGIFTFGLGGLAGVICGHISLSQIKRSSEQGRGMAIAGLVIGYVFVVTLPIIFGAIALGTAINNSFNDIPSSI